ncbi:hypothetical protein GCM10029976_014230 [Kribbella albertanoniae]|uniref:Uncharacterized protein n=1 Tax=Kribbella albertanoniae TaxID=1266829 RepID=A0A4R4PHP4_9ACTN|nr:hypothetical protein [Kribbella albertanoniae]TDC21363.1 hypothetical protein E1261_33530 [Kribbella albertanoniae]
MWWSKPKCPVRAEEQLWIEESLDWFVSEFGEDALLRPVVVPEASFFPAGYAGSEDDIRAVFASVCARLEVPPGRVLLEFESEEIEDLLEFVPMSHAGRDAAGHWQVRDGSTVVTIQLAQEPVAMVATIAHELGHERLLGETRIDPDRRDGEPLTDLFTVFFGMGIFTANAAFEFRQSHQGYRTSRLGYLTEAMYGYALARYAWLRGETTPAWAAHLDTNPRTYLKEGLKFLHASN